MEKVIKWFNKVEELLSEVKRIKREVIKIKQRQNSLETEIQLANEECGGLEERCEKLQAEVEYQKGLKQEAYRRSDKLEADNERLKAKMEDYIGLANVVDSFVTILPKHKLYDNIRQDVLNYLRKIKSERQ